MKLSIFRRDTPILKLPWKIDTERMRGLFPSDWIQERLPFGGAIALTHREGATDPWTDGLTQRALNPGEALSFSEADFKEVAPGFEGTYFVDVLGILDEACHQRRGRVRMFCRPPLTSSSLHTDLDVRLHVALTTSEKAFLVFPGIGVFRIPCDGHVYLVDTTRPHFAVNANPNENRVHLVTGTYCGFQESRDKEDEIVASSRSLFRELSNLHGCIGVPAVNP